MYSLSWGADYNFCGTTGVRDCLVRRRLNDETMDCGLELIGIGEYGFISSTVPFANFETSDLMERGAEVGVKGGVRSLEYSMGTAVLVKLEGGSLGRDQSVQGLEPRACP